MQMCIVCVWEIICMRSKWKEWRERKTRFAYDRLTKRGASCRRRRWEEKERNVTSFSQAPKSRSYEGATKKKCDDDDRQVIRDDDRSPGDRTDIDSHSPFLSFFVSISLVLLPSHKQISVSETFWCQSSFDLSLHEKLFFWWQRRRIFLVVLETETCNYLNWLGKRRRGREREREESQSRTFFEKAGKSVRQRWSDWLAIIEKEGEEGNWGPKQFKWPK